jgi:flagellar protein FlaG
MQSININSIPNQVAGLGNFPSQKSFHSTGSVSTVTEKVSPPTDSELKKAIEVSNTALKQIASSLEFTQDNSTGKALVRVYDRDTKELIRQFPTEEMVAVAEAIDNFKGLLIHQKA